MTILDVLDSSIDGAHALADLDYVLVGAAWSEKHVWNRRWGDAVSVQDLIGWQLRRDSLPLSCFGLHRLQSMSFISAADSTSIDDTTRRACVAEIDASFASFMLRLARWPAPTLRDRTTREMEMVVASHLVELAIPHRRIGKSFEREVDHLVQRICHEAGVGLEDLPVSVLGHMGHALRLFRQSRCEAPTGDD
jgi:hypothetical protein